MYLYLSVTAADELYLAVRPVSYDIPCAVGTGIGTALKGVVNKYLCGLFGAVQVPRTDVRSCNDQLPQCSGGHTAAAGIDYIAFYIVKGAAYGDVFLTPRHPVPGGNYGTFRRTVDVIQDRSFGGLHGGKLLAPCGNSPQIGVSGLCHKLSAHLCGEERKGNTVVRVILIHCHNVKAHILGDYAHSPAAAQCGVHIHHAGIKAVGGVLPHSVIGGDTVEADIPVDKAHKVAVGQHHTLGNPCGA